MTTSILSFLFAGLATLSHGETTSPEGLWKTIDDETGQAKALVRIRVTNGVCSGRIEAILDPNRANAKCDKCSDERKDQPILGMEIVRRLKNSEGGREWEDGEILDPANGKTYRAKAELSADGSKLEVRGYVGIPLLGRTQTWRRVE